MVPQEVSDAIDDLLNKDDLEIWWVSPIRVLDDRSPKDVWEKGDKKSILDLLEEIKGGFSI